jgi:serine/threonine protein kinase
VNEVAGAPEIAGYTPVRALKPGGFANVFVYRQAVTDREVAVKVLGERFAGEERMRRFSREANVTASLSTHPNIITIYLAGVTDDGRPYLVMEFCPGQDMADRVKRGPLTVAEVLRIGIRMAGAVETAHLAGILHRDIKPANILTAAGNRPVLTDFGIAAAISDVAGIDGLSVQWSPPEVLRKTSNTSTASDVYSLAATLWNLLVGRSPFVLPNGPNGQQDLVHRIANTTVPRTGRPDVPAGLERLLAAAMAKKPADRPATAMEFARSLQQVAGQAGYAETQVEILDLSEPEEPGAPLEDDDDPGTRIRHVVTVDPEARPGQAADDVDDATSLRVESPRRRPSLRTLPPRDPADDRTHSRGPLAVPAMEDTEVRPHPTAEPQSGAPDAPPPGGRRRALLLAAAGVVVAGGVTAAVVLNGSDGASSAGPTPTSAVPPDGGAPALVEVVPTPTDLTGARQADGSVVFAWQTPEPADGDRWVVRRVDPGADEAPQLVDEPTVTVRGVAAGAQACVEVALRRSDGWISAEPAQACAG